MIRARTGNVYVFGMDRVNIERLLKNEPILVELEELGGPHIAIAIFAAETLQECAAQIAEKTGNSFPPGFVEAMETATGSKLQ